MENQLNTENINKKVKLDFKDSKYATGRRKRSIAKVWVKKGSGLIHVNGKKMADYFQKANLQIAIYRPLTITKRENEFDVGSFTRSHFGRRGRSIGIADWALITAQTKTVPTRPLQNRPALFHPPQWPAPLTGCSNEPSRPRPVGRW